MKRQHRPARGRGAGPALEARFSYLFHRISARIAAIGNRHFKVHALNHYSARILVLLLQRGPLRTGDLVELMLLPQSTISTQLNGLAARGLIERHRAAEDNRGIRISLTARGREVAADCDALSRKVQRLLEAALDPRAQADAYLLLERVDGALAGLGDRTLHRFGAAGRRRRTDGAPAPVDRRRGPSPD